MLQQALSTGRGASSFQEEKQGMVVLIIPGMHPLDLEQSCAEIPSPSSWAEILHACIYGQQIELEQLEVHVWHYRSLCSQELVL